MTQIDPSLDSIWKLARVVKHRYGAKQASLKEFHANTLQMSRAIPCWRDFAKRLIAHETKKNTAADNKIPAACLAIEKLHPNLAPLMGSIGFSALLSRALALSIADVPWLRTVQVTTDGSFEGFEELGAQVDQDVFFEGCAVLLSHLLGLLVAFIGEDLTLRLVRQAWPKLFPNNLDFDEGGK